MHIARRLLRMKIQPIPMRWGSGDNYAYLVIDDKAKVATIIDPAVPIEVMPTVEKLADDHIKLVSIMNTHHHLDHSGGNAEMKRLFPNNPVIAGRDSPGVEKTPADGAEFKLGDNIVIKAIYTPCHTKDSICWYFNDTTTDEKALFTGDTLFTAGCGRFFEGNAAEMYASLSKLVSSVPKSTPVYPGHEYTKSNLKFVKKVLDNESVESLDRFMNTYEQSTGKFTIEDELSFNPFLKLEDPQIIKATGKTDPVEVLAALREMKNES